MNVNFLKKNISPNVLLLAMTSTIIIDLGLSHVAAVVIYALLLVKTIHTMILGKLDAVLATLSIVICICLFLGVVSAGDQLISTIMLFMTVITLIVMKVTDDVEDQFDYNLPLYIIGFAASCLLIFIDSDGLVDREPLAFSGFAFTLAVSAYAYVSNARVARRVRFNNVVAELSNDKPAPAGELIAVDDVVTVSTHVMMVAASMLLVNRFAAFSLAVITVLTLLVISLTLQARGRVFR